MQQSQPSTTELRERLDRFAFRGLHPAVRFGTTSDRYAGWIGQIYPADFEDRVAKRTRTLGGKKYEERTVPVESTVDYFQHYDVLEVDFTYYRPLVDEDGKPTNNSAVLQRYAEFAPDDARFILKVPNQFFSRRIVHRSAASGDQDANPDYLNFDKYEVQFHRPAVKILGERLGGILFEQEYQRKGDSPSSAENVDELDAFFRRVGREAPLHVEMRSPHLLDEQFFDWLETVGVGYVFSHWTWLPPLRKQWRMCGERFPEAGGESMVRLLTPLRVPYAKAYAATHPFDKVVDEIANSDEANRMKLDTVALAMAALRSGATLNILANNRAWGNAPELSRAIAERLIAEFESNREDRQG